MFWTNIGLNFQFFSLTNQKETEELRIKYIRNASKMGKCRPNTHTYGDLRITKTFSTAILMIPSASGETDSLKSTRKKHKVKK